MSRRTGEYRRSGNRDLPCFWGFVLRIGANRRGQETPFTDSRQIRNRQSGTSATPTSTRARKPRNEALKEQLAAERAAFTVREAALAGDLAAERQRADKAIAAFAALAERLDALAAERARPWWPAARGLRDPPLDKPPRRQKRKAKKWRQRPPPHGLSANAKDVAKSGSAPVPYGAGRRRIRKSSLSAFRQSPSSTPPPRHLAIIVWPTATSTTSAARSCARSCGTALHRGDLGVRRAQDRHQAFDDAAQLLGWAVRRASVRLPRPPRTTSAGSRLGRLIAALGPTHAKIFVAFPRGLAGGRRAGVTAEHGAGFSSIAWRTASHSVTAWSSRKHNLTLFGRRGWHPRSVFLRATTFHTPI